MLTIRTKLLLVLLFCWSQLSNQAEAHVKWFLDRPESEVLAQAKPALFTQWSISNLLPILAASTILVVLYLLNRHFALSSFSKRLACLANKYEAPINLFMALCLGTSLIYCAITKTLLVPNFIICSHCPWYLPYLEGIIGAGLILGICSRAFAIALLGLLIFALIKHGAIESLDLLPYYGLAAYFAIVGRNRFSLDYALSIDKKTCLSLVEFSHLIVRWSMSLGLIILAFTEKLLHPQLAMELLKTVPELNFAHIFSVSNEMFTLCSGLAELVLGVMLLLGIFPRLVIIGLAFLFALTTSIFGFKEFFGHAMFYGIIVSIALRGTGLVTPAAALWYFFTEQNGGWRPTSVATSQDIKVAVREHLSPTASYGTLKHLMPARPSKSLLAKQQAYLLSSKLAEDMQSDSRIALAS